MRQFRNNRFLTFSSRYFLTVSANSFGTERSGDKRHQLSGRRDKFHRLRRTSYTLVAKAFGVEAASRHAAHKQDLSRFYLDRSQIDADPLQALPRPV